MQSLDKKQIEIIVSDVENAKITFSHLADELVDHICCEVESLMNRGKTFDEAYELIKQQTGIKVLQKIQENTHYLIDKNYRRMKMTMKITGTVSLAMLGLATVMKIFHWNGASILLLLGFMLLCLVFFPSAIYANYKEAKIKGSKILHLSMLIGGILFMTGVLFKVLHLKGAAELLSAGWIFILFIFLPILLYIKLRESITVQEKRIISVGIIGLIIFELSTMFKVFHYPGATVLMVLGSILLVSIFLPLYTYRKFKETQKITGQYIFILIGTTFFILFSILLALNISNNVLGVFVNDGNNSAIITHYLELKNQKLYADFNSKTIDVKTKYETHVANIQSKAKNLNELIDSIKIELIAASDKVDKKVAKERILNVNRIENRADVGTVNTLMFGEKIIGLASLLKLKLKEYSYTLAAATVSNPDLSSNIGKLISTYDVPTNQKILTWEQFMFENNPSVNAFSVLLDIQKRVRMAESQAIQFINTQN